MRTLYTIGCPKCRILEKKLAEKGIEYEVCSDRERMMGMGMEEVPVLEVEGQLLSFTEAVKWINKQERSQK